MRRFFNDYGTLLVLLALCAVISVLTLAPQTPEGRQAGLDVASRLAALGPKPERIVVAIRDNAQDREFADGVKAGLEAAGLKLYGTAKGTPASLNRIAARAATSGKDVDAIVCTDVTGQWAAVRDRQTIDGLRSAAVYQPETYLWPTFLKKDNLINVSNQMVVISTMAIGMTMVIITGGIELSVGSMLAFASCLASWAMVRWGGAESAGMWAMIGFSALAVLACGCLGLFNGMMVTLFRIPPFIVTLATMMVISGCAYIISGGHAIYQIPWSYTWLGRGSLFWGIPVSVTISLVLYLVAHIVMTYMSIGRYIYAVGGNREAARLSGVPVRFVLFFVYLVTALLAGFGGIITTSQLKSGSPTYGLSYEMFVIASVVVGGTSLSGGEGKIFGTLIGSIIIAVIQNGMNLLGVESYTQKVVLGLVILGAVFLDTMKQSDFFWKRRKAPPLSAAAGMERAKA